MRVSDFEHLAPTRIVFGRGTLAQVGGHARIHGRRALLVCGQTAMRRHGVLDRVMGSLRAADVESVVYDAISADPKSDEVDGALTMLRRHSCDVILGLGGGSALDAAKAVGVATNYESVREIIGVTLARTPGTVPVLAIPTTAGSGAEVTRGAIVTDVTRCFKSGIRGEDVFPRVAIVDPSLVATMPSAVAAETGFDALTHAIETYVARKASPLTQVLSLHAMALLSTNLPRLAVGTFAEEEQDAMCLAALLGGLTVANASTCLPHRLQQAMGAVPTVDASHGCGLAALYPAWLERAVPFAPERFGTLARLLGTHDIREAVLALQGLLGLTATLRDWGFAAADVETCMEGLSGNLENDPIEGVDDALLKELYTDSL